MRENQILPIQHSRQMHLTHLNIAIHRARRQVFSHGVEVQTADTGFVPHQSAQNLYIIYKKKKKKKEFNLAIGKHTLNNLLKKCFWSDGPCVSSRIRVEGSLRDLFHQTGSFNHPRKWEECYFTTSLWNSIVFLHLSLQQMLAWCPISVQNINSVKKERKRKDRQTHF